MDHSAANPLTLPTPDYEAADVLVVGETDQLRALADEVRIRIVGLLRESAASTSALAERLDMPKGTVGHHVKVLERAGLIRVVRTRRVRAVTEKHYGRVARLFVLKGSDPVHGVGSGALAGAMLRSAAEEIGPSADDPDRSTFSLLHVRLSREDARRFYRRVERLVDDFEAADAAEGDTHALVLGFYPMEEHRP